jgi:hypothetical protein
MRIESDRLYLLTFFPLLNKQYNAFLPFALNLRAAFRIRVSDPKSAGGGGETGARRCFHARFSPALTLSLGNVTSAPNLLLASIFVQQLAKLRNQAQRLFDFGEKLSEFPQARALNAPQPGLIRRQLSPLATQRAS